MTGRLVRPGANRGGRRRVWFPYGEVDFAADVAAGKYQLWALLRAKHVAFVVDPRTGRPHADQLPNGKGGHQRVPYVSVHRSSRGVHKSPGWTWLRLDIGTFEAIRKTHNLVLLRRKEDDRTKVPKIKLANSPELVAWRARFKARP